MYRRGRNTEEGTENRSVLCVRTPRVQSHKRKCFHSGRVAALLRTQVFQTMEERRMKSEEVVRASCGSEPSGSLLARVQIVSCVDLLISSFVFGVSCQHLLRLVAELGPKRSRCCELFRHVTGFARLVTGADVFERPAVARVP